MNAINTSISYQSQFAPPSGSLNNIRTKSGAQSQMEEMKGVAIKPTSLKFQVENAALISDIGRHVNLKA